VRLAVQSNSNSAQPTKDCTCSGNRPTLPVENVSSVCLVNSKQSFTLQLVYESTLIKLKYYLWPPYVIREAIIFLPCEAVISIFPSSSFFPRLISPVADWMSTILPHIVWQCEFRMHVWNVLHAARWIYRAQKIAISAPSHNFVGLCLRN